MDFEMWSPFQSKEVKEICVNLTPKEKLSFRRRTGLYGLWIAVSLLIPLFLVFVRPAGLSFILAGAGVMAHILYIPVWQRKQRELLCSTSWAKGRGISTDNLPLFKGWRG